MILSVLSHVSITTKNPSFGQYLLIIIVKMNVEILVNVKMVNVLNVKIQIIRSMKITMFVDHVAPSLTQIILKNGLLLKKILKTIV